MRLDRGARGDLLHDLIDLDMPSFCREEDVEIVRANRRADLRAHDVLELRLGGRAVDDRDDELQRIFHFPGCEGIDRHILFIQRQEFRRRRIENPQAAIDAHQRLEGWGELPE